jgi:hypothetical protein
LTDRLAFNRYGYFAQQEKYTCREVCAFLESILKLFPSLFYIFIQPLRHFPQHMQDVFFGSIDMAFKR